jgi:hypothetical protein
MVSAVDFVDSGEPSMDVDGGKSGVSEIQIALPA